MCPFLLVEDHPLNQTIALKILKKKEMLVDLAKDGVEAVEKFNDSTTNYYDAILMDIRMPRMTGLEAARAIRQSDREDAKEIVIIAMSANAFDEDVEKSKEAGMNEHLSKPIEPERIYETLAAY